MYTLQQSISDNEPSEMVPCGLHEREPFLFLNCSYCGYRFTQKSTVNLAFGINAAVKRQTSKKGKVSHEQRNRRK